ncbi:MAG: hypothetical protein PHY92_03435 [Alphaproteobacteria bacterium]|nr:hypothetical protein [Alphaproteobacteria bacterium]
MRNRVGHKLFSTLLATQLLVCGMDFAPKATAQEQPPKRSATSKSAGDNEIVYRDADFGSTLTRGDVKKMKNGNEILEQLRRIDAGEPAMIGGVTKTDEEIVRLDGVIRDIRGERALLENKMKQNHPEP